MGTSLVEGDEIPDLGKLDCAQSKKNSQQFMYFVERIMNCRFREIMTEKDYEDEFLIFFKKNGIGACSQSILSFSTNMTNNQTQGDYRKTAAITKCKEQNFNCIFAMRKELNREQTLPNQSSIFLDNLIVLRRGIAEILDVLAAQFPLEEDWKKSLKLIAQERGATSLLCEFGTGRMQPREELRLQNCIKN